MGRELKAVDIAERHGVDRKTAYRWLVSIEKRYGAAVVGRRGRVLFTTEDAFASVVPLVAGKSATERRMRDLETRVTDSEVRLDKHALELAEFRRAAAAWFARQK